MKKTYIFTTTGNAYYHFHPIGVGMIFTYHVHSMQILTTCEHTGALIETEDYYEYGGLTKEQFKQIAMNVYKKFVEDGVTISLDYMDEPDIVGEVGFNFELMKN